MKAQVKAEIRSLKKELAMCKSAVKIIDLKSMIMVLETILEDLD